jgi:predicted TIM-barrel fold metal-dependent hydrolase
MDSMRKTGKNRKAIADSGIVGAETLAPSPIPARSIASDEFAPAPQTARQRAFEARVQAEGERLARGFGMSRRAFFRTASGMAAGFLALNDTYGPLFGVTPAEAAVPEQANARARALAGQFVMDMHTHFLRDDTRLEGFVRAREAVGKAGWNPLLRGRPQTIEDLKFANYLKEIYLDSDTKIALISGSPSEDARDWFLTNEMKAQARATVNAIAGTKRLYTHFIFTPGYPGWLDAIDRGIAELKPDSWKGYTVGDNTNKHLSTHPYRLDDEKLLYPAYEKFVKSGVRNVCIHKGLFSPATAQRFPNLLPYADVRDVGKAAKDWPQLNFIIYHSAYRWAGGGLAEEGWRQFEQIGRIEWVTDLAEIPARFGVSNVYADLGQIFAQSTISEPRLAAVMLGQLVRGLGADHVCWGTDAIWTGAPQWQIEALRRIEIPEALQKRHGLAPLGPADGAVKNAILGGNNARLYGVSAAAQAALAGDALASAKAAYLREGGGRSNLAYGYVAGRGNV